MSYVFLLECSHVSTRHVGLQACMHHSLWSYLLTTWFGSDLAAYFNLWCRRMFRFGCQQYVYVACCRLYYFYVSLIYGEYLVNVHFGDIPHTSIPHFTLHSAKKSANNFPQITRWQLSAFRKIPLNQLQAVSVDHRHPSCRCGQNGIGIIYLFIMCIKHHDRRVVWQWCDCENTCTIKTKPKQN